MRKCHTHTHTQKQARKRTHTEAKSIEKRASSRQTCINQHTYTHSRENNEQGRRLRKYTQAHTHTHSVRLVSVLVPGCLQSRWGFSWFLNEGFSWGSTGPQSLEQFSTAQHPPLTNQGGEHQPLSGRLLMPPLRRLRFYLPVATPWRGVVWESLVLFHGENDQPDTVCWFQSIAASVVLR